VILNDIISEFELAAKIIEYSAKNNAYISTNIPSDHGWIS
jgi:hypothetical protein